MSKQHIYQKEPFKSTTGKFISESSSYDARSGLHRFQKISWGEIPNGTYTASSISNTGNIQRFNLEPSQDIGSRSYLQIHQKSQNSIKDFFGFDTKGCIAVDKDAMSNINLGDTIKVKTREPSFSSTNDLMSSIVLHNSIFQSEDYNPNDYFNDVPNSYSSRQSSGLEDNCIIW